MTSFVLCWHLNIKLLNTQRMENNENTEVAHGNLKSDFGLKQVFLMAHAYNLGACWNQSNLKGIGKN